MNKVALYILVLLFFGCSTAEKSPYTIELGKNIYLDKAKEINIEEFMRLWMRNRKVIPSSFDGNMNEVKKDAFFTYFNIRTLKYPYYYKINNDELDSVNYKSIVGTEVIKNFEKEIIPQVDKDLYRKKTGQSLGLNNFRYNWQYNKLNQTIEIQCRCKANWGFQKIIDKTYTAFFSIPKNAFL